MKHNVKRHLSVLILAVAITVSNLTLVIPLKDSSASTNVKMEMPMKLIDDLKAFFSSNDQEIEQLKAVNEAQKNRLTEQAAELDAARLARDNANLDFIELAEHHETDMQGYDELQEKYDDVTAFLDRTIIVLFDVVRMYSELEAANDSQRTD